MATYILLSTLTDDGAETLTKNPTRLREVNQELEKLGARVREQYATLGGFDFVNIVDAPDNRAIARVSALLAARGSVRIMTLPAIPIEEFLDSLAK
ncbi:MAG: GYD domain-containing protein [Gemmatimonadaceae bacterium]